MNPTSSIPYSDVAEQVRDTGGATTFLSGAQPVRGYAVGTEGAEHRVRVYSVRDIQAALEAYVIDHGYELREGYALGAWIDNGALVLDLVVVHGNRDGALIDGRRNHQDAIYDIAAHETIDLRARYGDTLLTREDES